MEHGDADGEDGREMVTGRMVGALTSRASFNAPTLSSGMMGNLPGSGGGQALTGSGPGRRSSGQSRGGREGDPGLPLTLSPVGVGSPLDPGPRPCKPETILL